ncbi:hypothetical protein P872_23390 [Rhodonellum psychrophilum GCM71 = DSM 17998]|uniref:DUF2264 domain-containing protein n=2 Tax=Rhodonellum TaxID=336827 RepID=U5C3M1_9BACT|nr:MULTISPECIES: DUF2264 domain-containing protein [Rhodonellum]ERM84658.1 hypothetical protein P872_23390 [Rhodonellum psychrophilum GCM71 = DSM 17998]SDZ13711.1 hypothetical protein SAMN05444412_106150 [Rhodonellum ikkaensis]
MKNIKLLSILLILWSLGTAQAEDLEDRKAFISYLTKIADPVLVNLSQDKLKENMPIEIAPNAYGDRDKVTHLEAFGRLISGMAPWLELGPDDSEEGELREKYILLVHQSLRNATDPNAKDYMNFTEGGQPLVDAAFLAQGLLRAPTQLWDRLDAQTKKNTITALKSTRTINPYYSNWLLFTAMVEAALIKFDGDGDYVRISYALNKHKEWYLGDGVYGDGPDFHFDYYNSFVIQPMILDVTKALLEAGSGNKAEFEIFLKRARRYAAIQERLISPEGTYPVIGRSMAYRFGAFQALAQIALWEELPQEIAPPQVRAALLAIVDKHMASESMFDQNGWLKLGFNGNQPELAEPYISTGSLYLCAEVFLVLGLPASADFWAKPREEWTQQKIWGGKKGVIDKAI